MTNAHMHAYARLVMCPVCQAPKEEFCRTPQGAILEDLFHEARCYLGYGFSLGIRRMELDTQVGNETLKLQVMSLVTDADDEVAQDRLDRLDEPL